MTMCLNTLKLLFSSIVPTWRAGLAILRLLPALLLAHSCDARAAKGAQMVVPIIFFYLSLRCAAFVLKTAQATPGTTVVQSSKILRHSLA